MNGPAPSVGSLGFELGTGCLRSRRLDTDDCLPGESGRADIGDACDVLEARLEQAAIQFAAVRDSFGSRAARYEEGVFIGFAMALSLVSGESDAALAGRALHKVGGFAHPGSRPPR